MKQYKRSYLLPLLTASILLAGCAGNDTVSESTPSAADTAETVQRVIVEITAETQEVIENNSSMEDCHPRIITDSETLKYLEASALSARVESREGGVIVRICLDERA